MKGAPLRFASLTTHRLASLRLLPMLGMALGFMAAGALSGASPPSAPSSELVILSTADVKGMTSPCGCAVPMGGLARRAGFSDSVRAATPNVLVVDAGFFLPEHDATEYRDAALFMLDAMAALRVDAAAVSERDLRHGYSFLSVNAKRAGVPLVCANLSRTRTSGPAFEPYRIQKVGGVTVGTFGLVGDQVPLGPSADSLRVEDPTAAAQRTVAELKRKGAKVIVLLSQLGKLESEDLVAAVPGIDAAFLGHEAGLLTKGRMIRNTVVCYGGVEGQFMGRTILKLDARKAVASGDNEMCMLGPGAPEDAEWLRRTRAFEEAFNDTLRKLGQERTLKDGASH